jgi:hypothetical protein
MGRNRKSAPRTRWFGVKTLFRTAAAGKPLATDKAYDPRMTLVEERVVLFRARGFGQAIRAAEREAVSYARHRHVNPYGQRVVTRYLGACDAFELFDPPGSRKEVFSATEIVSKRVGDKAVMRQHLGHKESAQESKGRRNILNREYEAGVPARRLTTA